ncbi:MAG: SH3 domain-containing protein [Bacteroidetes bacterium]|nr:SH3 domain-containing protein [Bacteroidota bacterium]
MKKALLLTLGLIVCQYANSQVGPRLDFTPFIPQSIYQNPANTPWCTTFLALPGLSGINASVSNNVTSLQGLGLDLGDLSEDGFINEQVFNQLAQSGQELNKIRAGSQIDILGFGFRKGNHFFAFSIREYIYSQMNIPQEMLRFPEDQTQDFQNAPEDYNLAAFDFAALHYRPFTLHYAWTAQPGLTIGLQASYLGGKYSIKSFNDNLRFIPTNTNTLGFDVDGNITFLNSGFQSAGSDQPSTRDILLKPQNHGMAFGFGLKYVFPSQTEFMLSATNMGFIDWKKNMGYSYFNDEMTDKEQNFEEIWDQVFEIEEMPDTSYRQAVPPYFNIALNQYIARQTSIGAFYQASPYLGRLNYAAGVSINNRIKNWMGSSIGYIYSDGSHNVSASLSFTAGPVQLYMATDNVLGALNLSTARHFNSQIGINLVFGKKERPNLAAWDAKHSRENDEKEAPLIMAPTPEEEVVLAPVEDTVPAETSVSDLKESPLIDPFHFEMDNQPDSYVSKGVILIFQGPSLTTLITNKLSEGDTVRVIEKRENDWWLVQSTDLTGWLKPQDLLEKVVPPAESTVQSETSKSGPDALQEPKRDSFLVITDVPLYEQPYKTSEVLRTLQAGDVVVLYDKENYKWWYVAHESRGGWIESLYLAPFEAAEISALPADADVDVEEVIPELEKEETAEPVAEQNTHSKPTEPLNSLGTYRLVESTGMRAGPNQKSDNITRLRTGYEVELLERTNKYWWKVRYKDKVGYAKAAKLASEE